MSGYINDQFKKQPPPEISSGDGLLEKKSAS